MRRSVAQSCLALAVVLAVCGGYPTEPVAGRTEGATAPDFELPSAADGTVALGDYRNKKDVLLYFSMGPG